ncbi:MAG: hypothetical protein ACJKTH_01800 [Patescibacteria group bacterium UBA2163]
MVLLQTFTRKPLLALLAIFVAWVVFTIAVWLPNWRLVFQMLSAENIAVADKVGVLLSLYGSIGTNFTALSASYTVAIALLFGVNVALLYHYIKTRKGSMSNNAAMSVGGFVSGIFGVGCAACGTFILSSILGLVGGAGVIAFLPLGGEEFGLLGVALLGYSVYSISKKIGEPLVCET